MVIELGAVIIFLNKQFQTGFTESKTMKHDAHVVITLFLPKWKKKTEHDKQKTAWDTEKKHWRLLDTSFLHQKNIRCIILTASQKDPLFYF